MKKVVFECKQVTFSYVYTNCVFCQNPISTIVLRLRTKAYDEHENRISVRSSVFVIKARLTSCDSDYDGETIATSIRNLVNNALKKSFELLSWSMHLTEDIGSHDHNASKYTYRGLILMSHFSRVVALSVSVSSMWCLTFHSFIWE